MNPWRAGGLGLALLLGVQAVSAAPRITPAADAAAAPAFTHPLPAHWINSPPLTWAQLRGEVVLLEFWTFACYNCYRSIPWLKTLPDRFGSQGFRIVSVHTPEFDFERERTAVEAKVQEHGLRFPVMLDNDFSYWKALNNRFWPAFYLIDRQGRIRAHFVGETHAGDGNARAMQAAISQLLAEPRP